jgi:hypothetical protein
MSRENFIAWLMLGFAKLNELYLFKIIKAIKTKFKTKTRVAMKLDGQLGQD